MFRCGVRFPHALLGDCLSKNVSVMEWNTCQLEVLVRINPHEGSNPSRHTISQCNSVEECLLHTQVVRSSTLLSGTICWGGGMEDALGSELSGA